MGNDQFISNYEEERCGNKGSCCKILIKRHKVLITTRLIVIILFIIGIIFLGAGIAFIILTKNMFEQEVKYRDECLEQIKQNNFSSNYCTVTFNITETLKGEVIFLYHLSSFYQNHRHIFQSKSEKQLKGGHLSYGKLSACSPMISVNDSKDPKLLYLPCGLAPLSFFNDTYYFQNLTLRSNFSEEGISIVQEREKLYRPISPQYKEGYRWLEDITPKGTTDEHFIVWMRIAAMPDFIKVFSICHDCEISPGEYSVDIQMNYPQSMYDGGRSIIITTTSGLGSRSYFISITYIAVGGLSLLFAIICFIQLLCCPRQLGQVSEIFPIERSKTLNQRLTATSLPIRHSSKQIYSQSASQKGSSDEQSEKDQDQQQNVPFINIRDSSDSDTNGNETDTGQASTLIAERASLLTGNAAYNSANNEINNTANNANNSANNEINNPTNNTNNSANNEINNSANNTNNSANNEINNSANNATDNSTNNEINNPTNNTNNSAVNEINNTANNATDNSTNNTNNSANNEINNSTNNTNNSADNEINNAVNNSANDTTDNSTNNTTSDATNNTTNNSANNTIDNSNN